jgi:hypothetical protein
MSAAYKAFAAVLMAIAVTLLPIRAQSVQAQPLQAQEGFRPMHFGAEAGYACLNPFERRALVESGAVLRLAAAVYNVRSHVPGTLVHARLCRRAEGFVYVLTVLALDGKVTHVIVDAVKGSLVGGR